MPRVLPIRDAELDDLLDNVQARVDRLEQGGAHRQVIVLAELRVGGAIFSTRPGDGETVVLLARNALTGGPPVAIATLP